MWGVFSKVQLNDYIYQFNGRKVFVILDLDIEFFRFVGVFKISYLVFYLVEEILYINFDR